MYLHLKELKGIFCHGFWCTTYLKCFKLSTRRPTFTHHHTLLYTHVQSQCDQGPCDLVSDSHNSGTEAFLSFFKGWLMLSLRANTGTNWPPPPFFLSFSPWLFLSPYLLFFFSSPHWSSLLLYQNFFLFSPLPLISHSFFPPAAPPPHPPAPTRHVFLWLFSWCSAGEPRGREIIQSLCILQALWSAAEPRCTDTLVYLDWPSKQPLPWQIAWMLLRHHTQTHTLKTGMKTHSTACSLRRKCACGADSFKEMSNQKKKRRKAAEQKSKKKKKRE